MQVTLPDSLKQREGRRAMPPDHVHFNGSVNLADAESVMRELVARVPSGLRRIPDGETGDRAKWIVFQLQKFCSCPGWFRCARWMLRRIAMSSCPSYG